MDPKAYQRSLDYLYGLERFGMIFDLTQVEKILKAIDEPHQEVQAIHIGGTNGKGSTAAMIASILQKEGYRVGLYTSPHLLRFTERIKVDGKEIERDEVVELAEWMRERIEAAGITLPFTFFDFTTSMAFLYFKQKMVDLAILEVGLGGRLDSTNVVDPLLSIITNIDKDHVEQLGRSLLKIAGEKAGIIKKGRPLITAAAQPQVLRLFSRTCKEKEAPYFRVGRDFRYEWTDDGNFNYEGLHRKLWNVHLNLLGFHQITNGTTALGAMEVLEELGYTVSTDAMMEGLREVNWPGRLEMVSSSPRVVLDGAHNPAGALVLRAALEKEFQYDRLILLVGMMKDKDAKTFLETLAPLADHILLSKPHTDRSASPSVLLDVLGRKGKKAEVIEEMKDAIEKGLSLTREEDLLCITGSLYTIGEAKSHFGPTRG
jgi:dihydrofolate synthase/folylpolyglutamate synthase